MLAVWPKQADSPQHCSSLDCQHSRTLRPSTRGLDSRDGTVLQTSMKGETKNIGHGTRTEMQTKGSEWLSRSARWWITHLCYQ